MKKRIILILLALAVLLAGAAALYVGDYYHAEPQAVTISQSAQKVDGNLIFAPENPKAGFIFYPGGKVEYSAYAPLMEKLQEKDILCILVSMPLNLAVLDANAADGIRQQYPDIDNWYIGGHSLGGAMAASYAAKHTEELDGLVLLAAYSTADLSKSSLSVLQVYGSEDKVMNHKSLEKYASNLPDSTEIRLIEGGCHAWFGSYGAQNGDGTPSITALEQQQRTAQMIDNLIFGTN